MAFEFPPHKIFLVGEIAQAHDGSLGLLHSYVDALADAGVDAVKVQIHIAAAESSVHERFRVPFSLQDAARMDYWRRMEFTPEQWAGVKRHCDERGVEFLASPFSMEAFDLVRALGARRVKIASGEVDNFLLLRSAGRAGLDVILSTGMSGLDAIAEAVDCLRPYGNRVALLQCTTMYPTPPEKVGLDVMLLLKSRFGLPVGLSDHSGCLAPCMAAAALGAEVLEAHAVFDKRMFGPDTPASLAMDDFRRLAEGVRFIERCLASPVDKADASGFAELRAMFGKSLSARRRVPEGAVISEADLETRKPAGLGVHPRHFADVVGRRAARPLKAGDFIRMEDLA